eukprot:scaffold887_cov371-Pavlova_lutheri.AAC.1
MITYPLQAWTDGAGGTPAIAAQDPYPMQDGTSGHPHRAPHCGARAVRSMSIAIVRIVVVVDEISPRSHATREFHVGSIDAGIHDVHVHSFSGEVPSISIVQGE